MWNCLILKVSVLLIIKVLIKSKRTIMCIKGLIYINPHKEDDCVISELDTNWKTILSNYMASRYIKCNAYEVHNKYFIAIEDVDKDTIETINRCNIPIYSIDYIAVTIVICFKDEKSRDLVFDVLNVW